MSDSAADTMQVGTRVVMSKEHRWQGVGTLSRLHDNGLTCAVKWDSGRLDRSIKLSDLIIKKPAGSVTGNSNETSPSKNSNNGNSDADSPGGSPLPRKPQPEKTSSPPGKPDARNENTGATNTGDWLIKRAVAREIGAQAEATNGQDTPSLPAKRDQEQAAPPPPGKEQTSPGRPLLWAMAGAVGGIAFAVAAGALWVHRDAAAEQVRLLRLKLAEGIKPADAK